MSTRITAPAKRRYDGSGRQRTRPSVRSGSSTRLTSGSCRDGYAATSIEQIARDAGTSPQTVYAVFTNKAGILRRVVDVAIAGDHEDLAIIERPEPQAIFTEPNVAERLRLAVEVAVMIHSRSAHLIALTQSLAGSDPAVAELAADLERQVRTDTELFLGHGGRASPRRCADVASRRHRVVDHRPDQLASPGERERLDHPGVARLGPRHDATSRDEALTSTTSVAVII